MILLCRLAMDILQTLHLDNEEAMVGYVENMGDVASLIVCTSLA